MCRVTRRFSNGRFAHGTQTRQLASCQRFHPLQIPLRIQGLHPVFAIGQRHACCFDALGFSSPLLHGRHLLDRNAFAHGGIWMLQGRDWWLMRQSPRSNQQSTLGQGIEELANGLAQLHTTRHARYGRLCNCIEEDGYDWRCLEVITPQHLQRLRKAVIHQHAPGHSHIKVGVHQVLGQRNRRITGNIQWTCGREVVPHGSHFAADAERGHQIIEESVVVVRANQDDELGIKGMNGSPRLFHRAVEGVLILFADRVQPQQRRVRHAQKCALRILKFDLNHASTCAAAGNCA